jgi:hypothetical protein
MGVPLAFGWRHLLFTNWRIDADTLANRLPDALDVHEYDGTGWISVIPFVNVDTRPRGFPRWAGVNLPELNVRTYVTCEDEPGIYFFSLDAPSVVTVLGARLFHHLPYYYASMQFQWRNGRAIFRSRRRQPGERPAQYGVTYQPTGDPFEAKPGSLAEFLTERRRLYTQDTSGRVRYTDVDHERWTLYSADVSADKNTMLEAAGVDPSEPDPVVYYSPGVDVVTTTSKRWDRRQTVHQAIP